MNIKQLDQIPARVLFKGGTEELRAWLDDRGWRMSLLELDDERRRRRRTRPDAES